MADQANPTPFWSENRHMARAIVLYHEDNKVNDIPLSVPQLTRACRYLEDAVACDPAKQLPDWPQNGAFDLSSVFAPDKHPALLTALATTKELMKSLYVKALVLYTTDGASDGFAVLPKIHEEDKLAYGDANETRPDAIALYEKWMRVFSFAHDDFWCQDDRYTPDSVSTADMLKLIA